MNDDVKIITKKDEEEFEKFKDSGLDTFDNIEEFIEVKYNDIKEW